MNRDELRRLAIRLAIRPNRDGDDVCGECGEWDPLVELTHASNCPIAALEAEEAASKVKVSFNGIDLKPGIADGSRWTTASGEGWSVELKGEWRPISMELKDGTSAVGYVRMVKTEKTKGEFAGEFG